jgi:hypothetical protein
VVDVIGASITHIRFTSSTEVTSPDGGSIKLTATDNAAITALGGAGAGAGARGQGGGGAGAGGMSAAINNVSNTTQAYIYGAKVTSGGSLELSALSATTLRAATAAGAGTGAGGQGGGISMSGVGAAALNFVHHATLAEIYGGSTASSSAGQDPAADLLALARPGTPRRPQPIQRRRAQPGPWLAPLREQYPVNPLEDEN